MNADQIGTRHRSRLAYIYVRQSTAHQLIHHPESQRLQRDRCQRAEQRGWKHDSIVVLDEDLGRSAARNQARSGFERMVAEAALGKVGIIEAR